MRRLAVITALTGVMTLIAAAPAPAQLTLTPSSATFPPTPLRTDSAPIQFTLTNGTGFRGAEIGIGLDIAAQGTFRQTNTCPDIMGPMESCFIDVVFAPDLPTPVHKSEILGVGGEGGASARLSGSVKSSGGGEKGSSGGGKKKCKKKGKKRSAVAAKKKCKKKK